MQGNGHWRSAAAKTLALFALALSAASAVAAPFVYVTNPRTNTVLVLDAATNMVVDMVGVGTNPHGVAITPDGALGYVVNTGSNNLSVLKTETNTVIDTVSVGASPWEIAITPDGTHAYVANSAERPSTISVIDTNPDSPKFDQVIATIGDTRNVAYGMAITPDGTHAYVTHASEFDLSKIETETNTIVGMVDWRAASLDIVVHPSGNPAYFTAGGLGEVEVIDTGIDMVVARLLVICFPGCPVNSLAIAPDGAFAYLTVGTANSGYASVLDTNPNSPTYHQILDNVVTGGAHALGIAATPDGAFVYVANSEDHFVSVINTDPPRAVRATIEVGLSPWGVAITPN